MKSHGDLSPEFPVPHSVLSAPFPLTTTGRPLTLSSSQGLPPPTALLSHEKNENVPLGSTFKEGLVGLATGSFISR